MFTIIEMSQNDTLDDSGLALKVLGSFVNQKIPYWKEGELRKIGATFNTSNNKIL
jgi:hypothetical protein